MGRAGRVHRFPPRNVSPSCLGVYSISSGSISPKLANSRDRVGRTGQSAVSILKRTANQRQTLSVQERLSVLAVHSWVPSVNVRLGALRVEDSRSTTRVLAPLLPVRGCGREGRPSRSVLAPLLPVRGCGREGRPSLSCHSWCMQPSGRRGFGRRSHGW